MNCRPRKRRETPLQQIIRLLHKTHKEVHEILAIVSNPTDTDFSQEDAAVKAMHKKVIAARKRIPDPRAETTNQ